MIKGSDKNRPDQNLIELTSYDPEAAHTNDWPDAFEYHYWSADQGIFLSNTRRWQGQNDRLTHICRKISDNDMYWHRILFNYNGTSISDVNGNGGGVDGPNAHEDYVRDLSGLKIKLKFRKVNDAFHYTRLEYCIFENCQFVGQEKTGIGEPFFFDNKLSHSKLVGCQFENVSFFGGEYTNIVFYSCSFENVTFNLKRGTYQDILFQNCKFRSVDFSRVDIRSFIFWGDCEFSSITVNIENLMSFKSIGRQSIKQFQQWDSLSWVQRKRIKSVTYTHANGTSTTTTNYFSKGEKGQPRHQKFVSVVNSYDGLIKFYDSLLVSYSNDVYYDAKIHMHFVLRWLRDQRSLLSKHSWSTRLKVLIARHLLGYGDRPERPLMVWSINVILFSVLYLFSGIMYLEHPIKNNSVTSIRELWPVFHDWLVCLYFSTITSTTVGYGDIRPNGGLSMLFSSLESISGLLLFTMFTVVFSRRFFK